MAKKLTEAQVIRALKRLDAGWPDDLTLYASGISFSLIAGSTAPKDAGCDVYEEQRLWESRRITLEAGDLTIGPRLDKDGEA